MTVSNATSGVRELAEWASMLEPTAEDVELARRSLIDTVAVTVAASDDPVVDYTAGLSASLRWPAIGHALDFDDVHLPSTSHVSVVCAHATLASEGGPRHYLAAAGVMARLGTALGWEHYRDGWHTTCTAGAPASAVAAGLASGLDADDLARAMALAVPGAGGVRRAFGTAAKPLQVGFAADAGVRAARLAAAGASADVSAVDQWFALVGGHENLDLTGPAVPDGLAMKLHPCCYALQRPIAAVRTLRERGVTPDAVERIVLNTTEGAMAPLIHHDPRTGLAGKFSIEYAVVSALLDDFPGMASFRDEAVNRCAARELLERVELTVRPGGADIMAGDIRVAVELRDGGRDEVTLELPPGHPQRPPAEAELAAKVTDCVGDAQAAEVMNLDWSAAAEFLRQRFPAG